MATAKKTTQKKKVTTKAPAKKVTTKKASAKPAVHKTLRVSPPSSPFFSLKFTRQTVYWTILIIFIIIMQLWILKVQLDVVNAINTLGR